MSARRTAWRVVDQELNQKMSKLSGSEGITEEETRKGKEYQAKIAAEVKDLITEVRRRWSQSSPSPRALRQPRTRCWSSSTKCRATTIGMAQRLPRERTEKGSLRRQKRRTTWQARGPTICPRPTPSASASP